MADPQFILKTTPPRAPRSAVPRERLAQIWTDVRDRTAIGVGAPGGFGKTTLLIQWRRLWLEQGALVAWLTLDERDDPMRFVQGLLQALRSASGRAAFDTLARQFAEAPDRDLDVVTGMLAEVASLATPTALILDDGERLPEQTARELLTYLIHNAPPNFHVVVGSRGALPLPTWDLAAHGNFAALKAQDLRLTLEESIAILEKHFGGRLKLDDCVRLHEATEGWPIGLQLAAASIERETDLHAAVEQLSGRRGDIEKYFIESLYDRLPEPLAAFLTRIAMLDTIELDLCEAVTGCASAAAYVDQLGRDTPILLVAELRDWVRLHPLARDFLLARFERLPPAEQAELHGRAARWYASRERFDEAARHALAAGDEALAERFAEDGLWELIKQGKLAEAREWTQRMPPERIAGDLRLRIASGWLMALGDQPEQALAAAEALIGQSPHDDSVRSQAVLIAACAALFCDRPGAIPAEHGTWNEKTVPLGDPLYTQAWSNNVAIVALYGGTTEPARRLETRAPSLDNPSMQLVTALSRTIAGLAYLWEGNAYKAEASMRPALVDAERSFGRRSVIACLFAPMLAAALVERNDVAGAQAVLANRLDVIERTCLPDAVLRAYLTLARVARARDDERQALDVLDSLHAFGEERRLPRLTAAALAERVRIHALRSRTETVAELLRAIDAMADRFHQTDNQPFVPVYDLVAAIAHAYGGLARFDLDAAEQALRTADGIAARLRRGRDALTVKVLRAVVARQRNDPRAQPMLAEAMSLATLGGNERLLADTHPLAVHMANESLASPRPAAPAAARLVAEAPGVAPRRSAATTQGGMLTPKEAEVLSLLSAGLSNKVIARTMDISDETVKWHLKNLFSKLSAGTRKHAVDRARLLGLIAA
jgi:LuxR family maltose regulon positive regulatory protein